MGYTIIGPIKLVSTWIHWQFDTRFSTVAVAHLISQISIQGGPERMQHLRSLISKKPWTKSNECINGRTFFFLQIDTKINDFDEGVLILEPFFWGNVIFKICSFCIKSHVWDGEEFLWVAPPDCNAAKLRMSAFLYSCWLRFTKQKQTIYPGKPNNGTFSVHNCDFWDRRANLENDIASEKLPQNQNTFIKINDLGVILLGKEFYTQ